MANEYLKRQPTSTGNRKVFTWSGWVKTTKESKSGNGNDVFFCASSNNTGSTVYHRTRIGKYVQDPHDFGFNHYDGANDNYAADPDFRDFSSWSHYLCSVDTTKEQITDRVKIYVNGAHISDLATVTAINQNLDTFVNGLTVHYLGADGWNTSPNTIAKISMFDVFLVDGQALTPDIFGFNKDGDGYISVGSTQATDFRPGQWVPKSPRTIKSEINRRGGFGVNGFYLPMNDSSNFGADFHCAPNSIIKLKGEDLPQPRNGAPTTTDAYVSQLRSDPYAANLVLAVPGIDNNTNPELVTNGDFSNGTTGWTGLSGGSLSVEDGKLKITETTGAVDAYAVNGTAITTVVGRTYTIKWTFTEGTNTSFTVRFGNSGNQTQEYQSNSATGGAFNHSGSYAYTFTATATQLNLSFIVNQASSYGYLSNVSVKEAVPVKDYSADIKGSGTNRTPTIQKCGVTSPVASYYGSAISTGGADDRLYYDLDGSGANAYGTGDFTFECWFFAIEESSAWGILMQHATNGSWANGITLSSKHNTTRKFTIYTHDGSSSAQTIGGTVWALNQWHHVVAERYNGQLTLYVNGVADATRADTRNYAVAGTPASSAQYALSIGAQSDGGYQSNGYIQDVRVYKGVAKYKGGFDVPKPYTPVGFEGESWRQVPDTCKNNFCTMDPLHSYTVKRNTGAYVASILNFTEGNLNVRNSGNAGLSPQMAGFSSFGMDSGKWYWELSNWENPANERYGISLGREQVFTQNGNGAAIECMLQVRGSNGQISSGGNHNGTDYEYLVSGTIDNTNATAITSSSDVVGLAFDRDNMAFYVYTNGTLTASITNITTSKTKVSTWFATKGNNSSSTSSGQTYNFGQNPTFGGTITAGTYTDSNGKGLFKYQPPAGYLALCEDNLPTPAIADPGEHFKTVLYTGNGSARGITGVGFKPDFVWIKNRDSTYQHQVFDSVRGAGQKLHPSNTNVESTDTANVSSFDSNGFSFAGGNVGVNQDTKNHVAWCWKAGGAAVANTDGSINSSVSANQTAGFSIVSYTGTGSAGTVGHGLGKRPKVVIVKRRDASTNWPIFFDGISNNTNDLLQLNLTNATATAGNFFNGGDTTTTTFPLGTGDGQTNASGSGHIAYCWAEIPGYSKFSFYQGTGQTDGPFVYCGFKPAWVMIKSSSNSGTNWRIWDSSRGPTNPNNLDLLANTTHIENAHGSDEIDLLSNGFKIRSTGSWHNSSGGTYVFMAFAESPFQTANAK